ncbi:MAG: Uma2 family endonuclease [Anaerolineae bacterium]|nr:Uma2 family endonuclease [Anaerolineae bacterium]NUQ04867.1 Uma2 family endonuclease [Anaerolineae bacterium]
MVQQTFTLTAPAASKEVSLDDLFPISVERYEAMIRAGAITEDDSIELIHGKLVRKMGKNQAHIIVSELLLQSMQFRLPPGWFLSTENPILTGDSLPEPDARVTRGSPRDYAGRRVTAADIGLIIEVSDSTLDADRGVKLSLYAEAGIPIYWIINIPDRQIEVYTQPQRGEGAPFYASLAIYPADSAVPLLLDGGEAAALPVADLLP